MIGSQTSDVVLKPPVAEDGYRVFALVKKCPPLDENSMYCNLLQCSHFKETSVAAYCDDKLVGFISGYVKPGDQNTLFVWQVAVAESARGSGLATKMLKHILSRPVCSNITHLETTITEENKPSQALFKRLANHLQAELQTTTLFDSEQHFNSAHASETLFRIGPFTTETKLT